MKLKFIILFIFLMSINMVVKTQSDIQLNPLIQEWKTAYQTPPFDQIKNEHYLPAVKYAVSQGYQDIQKIIDNQEKPTFKNTVEAMEYSGKLLNKITSILFNLKECETSSEIQLVIQEVIPIITKYANDISLNQALFERVKTVYNAKEKLTGEQQRLLEQTYKSFVRNGANLNEKDQKTYRQLTEKLSKLSLDFGENVLSATNAYQLLITEKYNLKGLSESDLTIAAEKAHAKGIQGWLFDLSFPSYSAFMKYADNRDFRRQMYMAYNTKAYKDQFDNQKNVKEIILLRQQLAHLLGYPNYAEYVLEERMAEKSETIMNFLNQLLQASTPYAEKELQEVVDYARQQGFTEQLQRWDFSYYSNKLKMAKYNISDEVLKPYFKLENVIEGVFGLATKLYGITFEITTKIPVYHQDVTVYEVKDLKGKVIAILYLDFHPRASKRGGAWMTAFREQHRTLDGKNVIPLVQLVMNFTPTTATEPSLLTFDEVETFLHEFGHGLHGILSNVHYESLSGTNVSRDFVELPSQIMENWATEKAFLDLFAKHYKTGASIPDTLLVNLKAARNFQSGYLSCRQLTFGFLDMAWHVENIAEVEDLLTFERQHIAKTEFLPEVQECCITTAFSHVFSGGYAAGYYGYKWAEVLDADAFSLFKEKGIFDQKTANSFRLNILSKGGTDKAMNLYLKFRGRKPDVKALLERNGLK